MKTDKLYFSAMMSREDSVESLEDVFEVEKIVDAKLIVCCFYFFMILVQGKEKENNQFPLQYLETLKVQFAETFQLVCIEWVL